MPGRYGWCVLPQSFKNSPTLFGEALGNFLHLWLPRVKCRVIQYVDDLLLSAEDQAMCLKVTVDLLNFVRYEGFSVEG